MTDQATTTPQPGPCTCERCLAWRGEARCHDCGAVIPASWRWCWPCEQERRQAGELLQRWWTP